MRHWGTTQRVWRPTTSLARYREQIAKGKALKEAGERDGWEPGGYKWHKWDHLREEKQRAEVEARGRADVADLYE